jgi:hypothetical protein
VIVGSLLSLAMACRKNITDLPDELLLEIFSNLSIEDLALSVQHVNAHWKDVTQDDSLWKDQLFSPEYKMTDKEIARHLMNMPALRAFCPARGTNTKNIIHTMCKYCRDIRHIEFKGSHKLTNFRLQQIIKKYPHLETLHIPVPKESDQLCWAVLVGQFQNLTTLNFTYNYVDTVADGILKAIAEGCPVLLHLDLGQTMFQDGDVQYLLKRKGKQLLSFSVRRYISSITHRLLTDCCVNLENLWYENSNEYFPSTKIQFLSKLSKLHNLTLSYFDVPNIFKNQALSKLINLDLFGCTDLDDTALTGILTNCPQLKSLNFRGERISDNGLQHIGNCKNLEHLRMYASSSLTDKSMEYVGAGCPNLKHLDIGGCSGLTNKSTEYVCIGCQKLRYLNIESCPEMTDAVLENIFRSRKLEVLVLACNSQLLGTNFPLIPSNLIHLTELDVWECVSVDEKYLHELHVVMPNLKVIRHIISEEPDVDLGDATFFISQFT